MAQDEYKIDLQNTVFPMLPEKQTRTIIGANAREGAGASGYDENRAQIAYGYNIMPTKQGFDSIGFRNGVPAIPGLGGGKVVTDTRSIYGNKGTRIELTWDDDGAMFALIINSGAWISIPDPTPSILDPGAFSINSITVGTVQSISYIHFIGIGTFNYDEDTDTLVEVILTGLNLPNIAGLTASNGYLIAYTRKAYSWSSTLLPTDFTPDGINGAGGGNLEDIDGLILFGVANDVGIIFYTEANAVAATYTGNVQYPFKTREIINSKGGVTLDKVAYEANARRQYLYSQAGLQAISPQEAESILPDVTDFLSGKRSQEFDEGTGQYITVDLDDITNFQKKIKLISSRYLVISYGITGIGQFQYALIYDISLDKLGKIKLDHSDVFELHRQGIEDTREALAFMLDTGEVKVLNFAVGRDSNGVLILGRLRHTRTRLIQLNEVTVENVQDGDTLDVYTQQAIDGKNFTPVQGTLLYSGENTRTYGFDCVNAQFHSIVLIGKFNVNTTEINYTVTGKL